MHSNKIAHKDLKLDNILVFIGENGREVIKISDFGNSRLRYDEEKGVIKDKEYSGTLPYMSPQILRLHCNDTFGKKLDKLREYNPFQSDCWALGVCLYIMITAKYPFDFKNETFSDYEECYKNMMNRKYQITEDIRKKYSKDCLDLIFQLLDPKPETRLSAKIVLTHKWLN